MLQVFNYGQHLAFHNEPAQQAQWKANVYDLLTISY
jgi:hypothetical protein